MGLFKFIGNETRAFVNVFIKDVGTLVAHPGSVYELPADAVHLASGIRSDVAKLFEPLDDAAKAAVAAYEEAYRAENPEAAAAHAEAIASKVEPISAAEAAAKQATDKALAEPAPVEPAPSEAAGAPEPVETTAAPVEATEAPTGEQGTGSETSGDTTTEGAWTSEPTTGGDAGTATA